MSFGRMNTQISLVRTVTSKDAEGFSTKTDITLATMRAYMETKHASERWANLSTFSEATVLFRFRAHSRCGSYDGYGDTSAEPPL